MLLSLHDTHFFTRRNGRDKNVIDVPYTAEAGRHAAQERRGGAAKESARFGIEEEAVASLNGPKLDAEVGATVPSSNRVTTKLEDLAAYRRKTRPSCLADKCSNVRKGQVHQRRASPASVQAARVLSAANDCTRP